MEKKKPFAQSVEAFFAGKGFYIVLFLCVAVIGVSAWSMLAGNETDVEQPGAMDLTLEQQEQELPDDEEDTVPVMGEHDAADYQEDQPVSNLKESGLSEEDVAQQTGTEAPQPTPQAAPSSQSVPGYFVWPRQ